VVETPLLARGRPRPTEAKAIRTRNTPARAGKTASCRPQRRSSRKHPRSRGEDPLTLASTVIGPETPPLARGRLEHGMGVVGPVGNTPARAGKTIAGTLRDTSTRKHPRSRGEDLTQTETSLWGRETPPLARGRRHFRQQDLRGHRNTPARAGKTPS